jgi:hypothetical protein
MKLLVCYACFSTIASLHPFLAQTFSSAHFSQTRLVYVAPLMSATKFCTHAESQAKL